MVTSFRRTKERPMTEEEASHIIASRLTILELYRERSMEGVLRETTERCLPQVRELAARRLERAFAEGGDSLPRLWSALPRGDVHAGGADAGGGGLHRGPARPDRRLGPLA